MQWSEVRKSHPDQWLVIEALEASTEGNRRLVEQMAVIEVCPDGSAAMNSYRRLHQQHPAREFYFVHTRREHLDITERSWVGVRRNDAVNAQG